MAKYRGYIAAFVEAEADSEEIAEKLMQEKLVDQIRRGESGLVVWLDGDEPQGEK